MKKRPTRGPGSAEEILYGGPYDPHEEALAVARSSVAATRKLTAAIERLAGLQREHNDAQAIVTAVLPEVRSLVDMSGLEDLPEATTLPMVALRAQIMRVARRLGLTP